MKAQIQKLIDAYKKPLNSEYRLFARGLNLRAAEPCRTSVRFQTLSIESSFTVIIFFLSFSYIN